MKYPIQKLSTLALTATLILSSVPVLATEVPVGEPQFSVEAPSVANSENNGRPYFNPSYEVAISAEPASSSSDKVTDNVTNPEPEKNNQHDTSLATESENHSQADSSVESSSPATVPNSADESSTVSTSEASLAENGTSQLNREARPTGSSTIVAQIIRLAFAKQLYEGDTLVSGTAPAGTTVTVTVQDPTAQVAGHVYAAEAYTRKADSNGYFAVNVAPLKVGQIVTITANGHSVSQTVQAVKVTDIKAIDPSKADELPEAGESVNGIMFASALTFLVAGLAITLSKHKSH
ncbi:hypothetical protein ACWOBE_07315 [Hutsoniella sourekii]